MAITFLPTRTEGSDPEDLGQTKADGTAYADPATELAAVNFNNLADFLILLAAEVGLTDGSTVGSLREAVGSKVSTTRTLTAGAGLTGGGDLSADRSFAVDIAATSPQPIGTPAAGASGKVSDRDHVHYHGTLTDDDLHALATKDAHGFLSAADYDRALSTARKKVNLMRETFGFPITSILSGTLVGTGAAINQVATGYWQVQPSTGTTTTGAATVRCSVNNVYTGVSTGNGFEIEVRAAPNDALPDGTNDYIIIAAACLDSGFVTTGFGFIYDYTISPNWQAFTLVAGVYTYIDTGVAVAIGVSPQTQPRLKTELVGNAVTGTLFWYIDGVQVATTASAVGNSVAAGYFIPARIVKTLGTLTRKVNLSWVDVNQTYVSELS